MTDIRAFRGLRYDPARVEPQDVICPPYDIIGPDAQAEYHARSPFNIIRVELGLGSTDPRVLPNRYADAATCLADWTSQGVLRREGAPAVYLHAQTFRLDGAHVTRRGLIVACRLHDWAQNIVRPHEHTRAGPKRDRLALLEATGTNTSPLWLVYHDEDGGVARAVADAWSGADAALVDDGDEIHQVVPVTDPFQIGRIRQAFASRPVYIADGHHRYETAIHYRDACRQAVRDRGEVPDPDAGYEFAMVLFVDSRDPGLVIRPYHRVIGATGKDLRSVLGHLADMCNIYPLSVSGNGDAKDLGAIEQALGDTTSTDDHPCVLYTRQGAWKVSPRWDVAWKETLPGGHSDAWQGLDVVSVDWLIVQGGFGIEASHEEAGHPGEVPRLRYSPDAIEAIGLVARGEAEVAILVRPTEVGQVCAVADAGDRMPPKSTYFYPKPTTGLVLNRLDQLL